MQTQLIEYDHMLIDAKNNAYRAYYAGKNNDRFQDSGHDYAVIYMRFLSAYLKRFPSAALHLFWDAPKDEVWRHDVINDSDVVQVLNEYKGNRVVDEESVTSHSEVHAMTQSVIRMLQNLAVRQYSSHAMEADDLIYAFVKSCQPHEKILLISSDSDLRQISYRFDNVDIYDALRGDWKVLPVPTVDPVIVKALSGDKTDNIKGYHLIGPKRSKRLAEDPVAREEFFKSDKAVVKSGDLKLKTGKSLFNINKKLIDLALCPALDKNVTLCEDRKVGPIHYDLGKVMEVIQQHKIKGMMTDLKQIAGPFKNLSK